VSEHREQGAPPPREAPQKVAAALAFCRGLFERLGARVKVEAQETAEAIGLALQAEEGNAVELSSPLVEAVQVLANRVVNPSGEVRKWVNLEVGGFRDDADPVVQAMAERLAAAARRTGQVLAIAPMTARERRQVHLALQGAEDVVTRSEGEGLFRTLMVVPGKAPGA